MAKDREGQTGENGDGSVSALIQISGMWINKSKDGETTYMAGYLGGAKLLMFKNKFKKEDKHPDYVLYVASNPPNSEVADDEDIPF